MGGHVAPQRDARKGTMTVRYQPARRSGWPLSRRRHVGHPRATTDSRAAPPDEMPPLLAVVQRLWRRAAVAVALLVLLAVVGLVAFRASYGDRVYPGVVVGGQPLGGLGQTDARAALTRQAQSIENGTVLFTYQGKTWAPTLAQLGVTVDVDRSLNAAMAVGRDANAWDRLRATSSLLRHDE